MNRIAIGFCVFFSLVVTLIGHTSFFCFSGIGCTEGQVMSMAVSIVAGYFGHEIFRIPVLPFSYVPEFVLRSVWLTLLVL